MYPLSSPIPLNPNSNPKMPPINLIFTLTLSILTISTPSLYETLESHSLPIGLFPKGITNFTINPSNGRFQVYLQQSCDAKFESTVRYDLNVSGTIRVEQLGELSGIAAQELFLWFPVKGIGVDIPSSGLIYFDVGVVFKEFSVTSFESPRDCLVGDRRRGQNRLKLLPSEIDRADEERAVL